jgi:hypothetical protein
MKKSFLQQLGNLSEDITAENADVRKIFALVHNQTDGLEMPVKKQGGVKPFRAVLVTAMSLVVMFTVIMTASAEFREMILAMFTPTETVEIIDGLERDSFLIFDMKLTEFENITLGTAFDTIAVTRWTYSDLKNGFGRTYYEYSNGGINPIETERVNTIINFNNIEYNIIFDYGIRADGRLIAHVAAAMDISDGRLPYYAVEVIEGRTDVVVLCIGTASYIYDNNLQPVLFDLATLEIIDYNYNLEGVDLSIYDMPVVEGVEFWHGSISRDGTWLAYIPDAEWSALYIYNMETKEKFNLGGESVNNKQLWMFTWLADDVIAVSTAEQRYDASEVGELLYDDDNQEYIYKYNRMGRHLYVFRINEDFLNRS